jgi:hypothetical protein
VRRDEGQNKQINKEKKRERERTFFVYMLENQGLLDGESRCGEVVYLRYFWLPLPHYLSR